MDFMQLAEQEKTLLLEMRRYLHQNPELSGQEDNTVRYIEEKLTSFGIQWVQVDQGGVLGFIDGDPAKAKAEKTLLLRADCDALPIQEDPCNLLGPKTCVSKNPGVQHACGHDAHTAVLLAAAKILNENRDSLPGRLVLSFERGEEGNQDNLYYLLKYLEDHKIKIDGGWGMHVFGEGESGTVHLAPGPVMAGNFFFEFTLTGKGGHGARPDHARNPIDCFNAISNAVSQIRMKQVDPFAPATLTICFVESGTKSNVIPDTLRFGGNGRFYDTERAGKPMHDKLLEIVQACAKLYGCQVESQVSMPGYSVINNRQCYEIANQALPPVLGAERVLELEPMMGSETFAFYTKLFPCLFAYYGIANEEKGITVGVHQAKFDIDEEKLHGAVACTLAYAQAFLRSSAELAFTPFKGTVEELYHQVGRKIDK